MMLLLHLCMVVLVHSKAQKVLFKGYNLTLWRRNYFFNFSTSCIYT